MLRAVAALLKDQFADDDYVAALTSVVEVAESGVEGFAAWPLCSFVERHGSADPEASLNAMRALTRQFSCEFAIRPFLELHLSSTLAHLQAWASSNDEHVRRLVSEGTRPILPWGPKVQSLLEDPRIGIGLLAHLRTDASETVRRSVANHLNDVAKGVQVDRARPRAKSRHPRIQEQEDRHRFNPPLLRRRTQGRPPNRRPTHRHNVVHPHEQL